MDLSKLRRAHRVASHGVPPQYPVAQFPNAPLLAAWAALAATRLAPRGRPRDAALALHLAAGAVWAAQEAKEGANGFRRALGAGGLAYVAITGAAAVDRRR